MAQSYCWAPDIQYAPCTSLAAEQRIIRKESNKLLRTIRRSKDLGKTDRLDELYKSLDSITTHSRGLDGRGGLREMLRYAHLCYAFMREQTHRTVESTTREGNQPSAEMMHAELARFGMKPPIEDVERWLEYSPLRMQLRAQMRAEKAARTTA